MLPRTTNVTPIHFQYGFSALPPVVGKWLSTFLGCSFIGCGCFTMFCGFSGVGTGFSMTCGVCGFSGCGFGCSGCGCSGCSGCGVSGVGGTSFF
jgi:hypothetical protein